MSMGGGGVSCIKFWDSKKKFSQTKSECKYIFGNNKYFSEITRKISNLTLKKKKLLFCLQPHNEIRYFGYAKLNAKTSTLSQQLSKASWGSRYEKIKLVCTSVSSSSSAAQVLYGFNSP